MTHTGGYFYVSQADDGTLAALVGGEKLQKLSRTGQVLAEFSTYVSDGSPVGGPLTQFHGPFDPEISPDGSKIAFEYFNDTYDAAPGCNELTVPPCYAYTQSQGVGITSSTGFGGQARPTYGPSDRALAATTSRAATKASVQAMMSSVECAADSCTRMRAFPSGTTG